MMYPRPTTFTVDVFPPLEGGSVQHRIETSFSQERALELSLAYCGAKTKVVWFQVMRIDQRVDKS